MFHLDFFRRHRYIGERLNRNLVALFTTHLIQSIAMELMFLFGPIFIFVTFANSYRTVFFYFLVSFALYAVLVPVGAKIMSRIGLRTSMIIALPLFALYFFSLYFFASQPLVFFFVTIVLITLYRMFYWVPYHTELAEFTDRLSRGRELALLRTMSLILMVVTPLLGGFLASRFGFPALFVTAAIIALIAMVPLVFIAPVRAQFTYTYGETFRRLFRWGHRRMVLSHLALGALAVVETVFWPVFIFVILTRDVFEVGAVSSLIVLALVAINLIVGAVTDRYSKQRLLRFGTLFLAAGWLLRSVVQNASQIFLTSTFYNFGNSLFITPFQALYYERAADQGHYVDEYTVIREVALNIGKVLMLLVMIGVVFYFGPTAVFYIAALMALVTGVF